MSVSTTRFMIDWERAVSKPQKAVKDFLRPFWCVDMVLEEFRIPGSLLRLDLFNVSRGVVIEVSPNSSHAEFNPFFHHSLAGYKDRIKKDLRKQEWVESSGYRYAEVTDDDFPLTVAGFEARFNIVL